MTDILIGNRPLGLVHPTLVVAELGVNHDGSLPRALELVRFAASAGADAIKVQVFNTTRLMHPRAVFARYQKDATADTTPADMLRRYQLPASALQQIFQRARELNLIPLATPFSPTDVEALERLSVPAVKIASPDLVNRPLLMAVARLRKPMLVSTGGATMDEVERTAGWLRETGVPFALLHCISSYPAPKASAHLCWIGELARRVNVPIGYSDHTTEVSAGALAVAAGAVVIEKHLTYDRAARGPDHAASSDPSQFERYVRLVREAEVLRGIPGKHVLEAEKDVRLASRQSLVARRTVQPGSVLTEDDLTVQRPLLGVPAESIFEVVGRRAACVIRAGTIVEWEMLEGGELGKAA